MSEEITNVEVQNEESQNDVSVNDGLLDLSIQNDPAVKKLLEYAKEKKSLSYEEMTDILPESITNSEKIEYVLSLLESNNIQLVEEDNLDDEEAIAELRKLAQADKKRVASSDKESAIDDPIRLYLREIGREHLLSAEQEIELSKQMENGENIIKNVIKKSGMILTEFYHIAGRAYSKKDAKELSLSKTKKEISEYMSERRRLNTFYKETLKTISCDLKDYIDNKKKLIARGVDYREDNNLQKLRKNILAPLEDAKIHPEEINSFSDKFVQAAKKIKRFKKRAGKN
ncbi:MAG: hypothetical protein Ta2B_30030 [Termitinemataceae bacterium]|nr:MAG: hypothetical protein Ta2B_30030 [Termitinemataceae bacterium]